MALTLQMCSGGTFMLERVFINMKKKWNAIMAVFCILLTACTNSDNTDTNQIIAETSETESVNSEISNSQTAHDVESESSVHKVYPANGSVKKLLSEFAVESVSYTHLTLPTKLEV